MNLLLRIDINIVAIIISIIFLRNISSRLDIKEKQNKAFIMIFKLNMLELVVETLTCIINKQPFSFLIYISTILHVLLFILGPFVTYQWFLFAKLWINKDTEYKRQSDIIILIPLGVNTLLALLTPMRDLVFYINQFNVYHRGPLFFIPVAVAYFYLLCGFIMIFMNRRKISRIEFLPLFLFGVFPAAGGFIQAVFYGFLLMWSSIAFSLIILYLYLQQQMIHFDYLTGAWTREKFCNYLIDRIGQKKPKNFSIVFIDLDDFKKINDTYGHEEGDRVLTAMVDIIKNALQNDDFVTRYGGDEFVLFLNVNDEKEVEETMKKISEALTAYNKCTDSSHKLDFSYGYELYNFDKPMTAAEYIHHIDKLMYQNKNGKKIRNND